MNDAGLPEKWRLRFQRDGNRCEKNDGKEKKRNQRITLKNISGSFVVILVGMFSSVFVFIIELILRRRREYTSVAVIHSRHHLIPLKKLGQVLIATISLMSVSTKNHL